MKKFSLAVAVLALLAGAGFVAGRSGLASPTVESETTVEPAQTRVTVTVTVTVTGDPHEVALRTRRMLAAMEGDQAAPAVDVQ